MRHLFLVFLTVLQFSCTQDRPPQKTKPTAPKEPETEILVADSSAIHVRLGLTEEIMVEGVLRDLTDLEASLRNAYNLKGDTATVVLNVLRETPYGNYAEAQRVLEEILASKRDSVALLRFEKHYDDLESAEKYSVNRTYHLRILERIKR